MTKTFAMAVSLALIVTVAVSPVWAAGGKVRSDNSQGEAGEIGNGAVEANRGVPVGESVQNLSVQEDTKGKNGQSGTSQILTDEEAEALLYMREEEKLARDVYSVLAEQWLELAIFANIAASEQKHMDEVLQLFEKYQLTDPSDEPGVFVEADLQKVYGQLVEKGLKSIVDALEVGVSIEKMDIEDLDDYLSSNLTDKKDITQVFENLLEGSKNHLNAFDRNLENY